jgi:type I restriction enzyme S subunit
MRPYLRSANVTWSGIDLSDVKEMNFEPAEARVFELKPGDLLLNEASGSPNEVGKPAIWRGEIEGCCFQNTLLRVQPHEVSIQYLYWYCRATALNGRFGEAGRGVNIRHLGKRGLAYFALALPPLAEQERIVAAIEELLSRLDSGTGVLESVERRLRLFEDAVEARLLAAGWPSMTLASLAEFVTDGDHRPPPRAPAGVPHLTAKHVRGGQLTLQGCTFVSEEGYRQTRSRYEPRSGDVIVTCVGTVGEIAVVPAGLRFSADRNLAAVRLPTDSRVRPEWVAAVLATARYRRSLMAASGSTAQPHLYLKDLRRVEIPVPPRSAQDELLAELHELNHRSRRLDATLNLAEHRSAAMRRSILAAAFSGQLVPQDPDDEPASVLLDRIRAERVGVSPTKRTRKVKP